MLGLQNDPQDTYDVAKGRITNPTVHIALNQLRTVTNELLGRFPKPDRLVVEIARELKLNERQKADRQREIGENTRAAIRRSEKLLELGQKDSGYNRALLKLWEELSPSGPENRVCVYCGKPIGIRMLFSAEVDIDHILPWSRTLDDGQSNRIVCHVGCNRMKGDRAPSEVSEWAAEYDTILERASYLPVNKRRRFARDAMEAFEGDGDFLARQLTDTQYLSRLAREYLEALYPSEETDGSGVLARRNHVLVVPGRMTEMLRRHWCLNSILPDHNFAGTAQPKNRKDHRHHAIDAAVLGVTTRSLLQKIATESGRREAAGLEDTIADIAPPWPSFRDDLKSVIDRIVVSHKPDHGTLPKPGERGSTAGRLHNDTAYGITGETDWRGNTVVVRRKPFLSLAEKDIPSIRDCELRNRMIEATTGTSGREFADALARFRSSDPKFRSIRRVRVTESLSVIPIRDRNGRAYKGFKGDANFRYDVWEMPDGKWLADVVTMFDAHRPDRSPADRRPHPAARKVLALKQNDMVAYEHPAEGRTIGRVVKFNTAGQIFLAAHNESGSLKSRDADREDPFKYFSKSASGLRDVKARQVRVDASGRVYDPGPQDRRSRPSRNVVNC